MTNEGSGTATAEAVAPSARPPGLLGALVHPAFALIAVATLVSNIGVWMRDTTSAWSVASGQGHHSAVALVQAATALPTFLLALPAGVLADHYDRRRLLILCQLVLAAVGLILAGLAASGRFGVGAIIGAALVAGSAAALGGPAFQAIVPSLVPRAELRSAVALSSISFNIARVIGPTAGGMLLALSGAAATYFCNAIAYCAVIAALLLIRLPEQQVASEPVRFRAELHDGLAVAAGSAPFRHVLAHAMGLYCCAACYLALTPLVAHDLLGRDPSVYGALLASIGGGSVVGAVLLSGARRAGLDDDRLLLVAGIGGAAALAVLATAHEASIACAALALSGATTLVQLTTLNAAAQLILPASIRGRGLAIYMAATFGCMAVGSLLWGAIADAFSIRTALALGAAAFALLALGGRSLMVATAPSAALQTA